jgi:hypothetical protein
VFAVAGAVVTVVAGCEVVWVVVVAAVAVELALLAALAAVVPGIVIAPMAAKSAVATVAAAAETTVRRRPSRSPASRLLAVGLASVLFMTLRMGGVPPVLLRTGWELAVKIRRSARCPLLGRAGVLEAPRASYGQAKRVECRKKWYGSPETLFSHTGAMRVQAGPFKARLDGRGSGVATGREAESLAGSR